jgi:hypothetical protein
LRQPPAKIGTVTLVQLSLRRPDVGSSAGELGGDADWSTRRRQRHRFWSAEPKARATPRPCGIGDKQSQTVERIRHAPLALGPPCRPMRSDGISTGRAISRAAPRRAEERGWVGDPARRLATFQERPQPRPCTMSGASCPAGSCGSRTRVVGHRSPASEQAVHRPLQYRRMIAQARGFSDRSIGSRAMTREMNSRRTGVGKFTRSLVTDGSHVTTRLYLGDCNTDWGELTW